MATRFQGDSIELDTSSTWTDRLSSVAQSVVTDAASSSESSNDRGINSSTLRNLMFLLVVLVVTSCCEPAQLRVGAIGIREKDLKLTAT